MNVVVVYNSASGGGMHLDALKAYFISSGINVAAWFPFGESTARELRRYIKSGETIAVVGGDGTVSAVAALVAGTKAILAPLPGGTLNHFTKDLGITQDIETAIRALKNSKIRTIDAAKVNDAVFINNSSIGLYPSVLRTRTEFERHIGKWPAAVVASFRSFIRMKTYVVTVNNEEIITPFLFVGNGHYDLTKPGVTQRTSLTSGRLSVFIAKTASRMTLLKIALMTLVGNVHMLDEFEVRSTPALTIRTKQSTLRISKDGEVVKVTSPVRYEILAKSLNVRF